MIVKNNEDVTTISIFSVKRLTQTIGIIHLAWIKRLEARAYQAT